MREIKRMQLRYAGVCTCGTEVAKGELAGWDKTNREVVCLDCLGEPLGPEAPSSGVPGASLTREYERRHANRERRVRERFPKIGGLILALSSDPETTEAFRVGADGETRLATRLQKACPEALFLHNRRRGVDQSLGDIDHIAIAPSGVFIVDAKNYRDAKVTVAGAGFLSRGPERLIIRGRDQSKLVESLKKQKAAVEEALGGMFAEPPVAVSASFCFLGADLPMFKALSVQGFSIRGQRGTVKMVNTSGDLSAERRSEIWHLLAEALPSA